MVGVSLYRKYRPASFAEVVGQEQVTKPLSAALDSGRINHAYLFSGPRGCGKTSSARILARSLNCAEGPTSTPCGRCDSCRSLAPGGPGNLDVTELDAASHNGVEDMRELRDRAYYAPADSRYRVFIIDEAHMISNAGSNALLKIVEEPPEHLIFIFATTEPEKVIGTIRSRTHHYPFRLLTPQAMRGLLQRTAQAEGVHVDDAVYPLVIRAGGGSPRDSLSILDQLLAGAGTQGLTYEAALPLLGVTDVTLLDATVDALADGDKAALFAGIDEVIETGIEPRRFVTDLLDRLRDLMVMQAVPEALEMGLVDAPTDRADVLRAQAQRFTGPQITRLASEVNARIPEMRGATSPRLLLEILCAHLVAGPTPATAPAAAEASAPAAAASQTPRAARVTGAGGRIYERRSARLAREQAERQQREQQAQQQAQQPQQDAQPPAERTEQAPQAQHTPHTEQAPQAPHTDQEHEAEREHQVEQARQAEQSQPPAPETTRDPEPEQETQPHSDSAAGSANVPAQSAPAPQAPDAAQRAAGAEHPAQPEEQAAQAADAPEDLVEKIRDNWAVVREQVGKRNRVAQIMLTEATVLRLEESTLVIGHNTGALAQRLNAQSNNADIVAVVQGLTNTQLQVRCEVGRSGGAGAQQRSAQAKPWAPEGSPREHRAPQTSAGDDADGEASISDTPAPTVWGTPAAIGGAPESQKQAQAQDRAAQAKPEAPARPPRRTYTIPGAARRAQAAAAPTFGDGTPLPPEPDDDAAAPPDFHDDSPAAPGPRVAAPPTPQAPATERPAAPAPTPAAAEAEEDPEEREMREAARQPGTLDRRDALTMAIDLVAQELGARPV
nr:DNA polymerase III subunit gamma and tau [Corynebacterium sp. c6VSa_13]